VIALFDNDTAAHAAVRGLKGTKLPGTIRVVFLPELELARHYPTLGPQGLMSSDVNAVNSRPI